MIGGRNPINKTLSRSLPFELTKMLIATEKDLKGRQPLNLCRNFLVLHCALFCICLSLDLCILIVRPKC